MQKYKLQLRNEQDQVKCDQSKECFLNEKCLNYFFVKKI